MAKNVWLKKLLLGIAGGLALRKLNKASKDCKKAQMKALMNILANGKDSDYGKKHNFANIRNIEDFQKNVPINTYESLKPYLDRIAEGEADVLFPGKPLMFGTTSGTTKEPKLIPISEIYYKTCYKGLSKVWLYTCVKQNPSIFDGYDLSIVSKAVEGYTKGGLPYGSMSGHQYTQIPGFMKDIHIIPYSVICLEDYEAKYYCLCRLLVEVPITYAIMANPSSIVQINRKIEENAEDIIKDIEAGTLNDRINIPLEVRKEIEALIKPNPARAAKLRKILSEHDHLYPRHIWPGLALLNVWKCGNSGLYLKHVMPTLPDKCVVREFAYQATECRAGIVLDNDDLGSVMTCHVNYFEFIRQSDLDQENPHIYQSWELEKGERYNILVTTLAGLYRYNMNDIMEVEGFYNEFPKLVFIQKGAGVTSLTGEKLHESQLMDSVSEAESELGIETCFYLAFGDFESSSYRIYIEFKGEVTDADCDKFTALVEEKLKKYNPEYLAKRDSKRLNPLTYKKLGPGSYQAYKAESIRRGARDGQFKLVHLMIDDKKKEIFETLVKGEESR